MKKQLRIAQVVETLEAGGAEGLAVDIANNLAARGHVSHLIVMDGSGPFRTRVHNEVHLVDLGFPPRIKSVLSNANYFRKTYGALANVLKENRVEVVQTHLPKANFLGLFLGVNKVARVHPTVHNNREFDYGVGGNGIKDFLRKRAYRQMLSSCGSMIAVSQQVAVAMAGELKVSGKMADRIVVVPNGVAVPPVLAPEVRNEVRQSYSVSEDETLLVGVGRLTRQKNFTSLVESLSLLPDSAPPWKCIIAGEGELRESVTAGISDRGLEGRVILAGHVSDVGRLLGSADVFCLSSLFEGLPLVLLEAMAVGLPVCAYGIDGVTDVVEDGSQAVLARPEDATDMARAIHSLLENPDLRQEMGAAGRSLVETTYNFERVVNQLEELYLS